MPAQFGYEFFHSSECRLNGIIALVLVRTMNSKIYLGAHHNTALADCVFLNRTYAEMPKCSCTTSDGDDLEKTSSPYSGRRTDVLLHIFTSLDI